jgi:hypothetical protein
MQCASRASMWTLPDTRYPDVAMLEFVRGRPARVSSAVTRESGTNFVIPKRSHAQRPCLSYRTNTCESDCGASCHQACELHCLDAFHISESLFRSASSATDLRPLFYEQRPLPVLDIETSWWRNQPRNSSTKCSSVNSCPSFHSSPIYSLIFLRPHSERVNIGLQITIWRTSLPLNHRICDSI